MAQWRLIKKSIVVRCVMTWNFVKGIPKWLARNTLALTGWEAQASAMYRGNSSTRNTNQANGSARAYSIHPIIFCLIGIAGFQPVILVFAAERCVAPEATRVVSVQGNVTWSVGNSAALEPAKLNDLLCVGDTVRVGTKSRAVLRLPNETTIPLDQNTIFQLKQPISEKEPTLIELIQGAIHVITRTPKPFKVNTPYMNAAVEGTEFYVGVDSEEARVAVIEGKVNVSNEQGAVLLVDNEAATAKKGQAPQKTLTIKPRDAVQWALYYPPLFDPRSRTGGQNLSASHELYSQGKITEAIESLNAIPEAERNGDYYTYRAGLLLLVGRADEAEPDIETALKENGNNTDALSLKAIIAIVQNDKAKALELANQAVSIDDNSASARIALSYALQANFKIEDALKAAREATERDANNALTWARVAELELSIPNYDKSKQAAEQAVKLNSNLSRTQSILGFANLTHFDTKSAEASFNQAIELDQSDPLPRLGLGLTIIRKGRLEEGREQIEIAASLDPESSLVRSYLGKAYFEEKRDALAGTQFDLAKERDQKDPTPHFYDAIEKQTENRSVEALQALEKSIELNDNRAVYRSRLLLDQDQAARSASQARIFSDLGFEQLALIEAYKSLTVDPSNYSAHRLLADAFSTLSRHEIATISELLQSQLWQPFGINASQPKGLDNKLFALKDAGPSRTNVNEYNSLFSRDQVSLYANGLVGNKGTIADQLVLFGSKGALSFSVGQYAFKTDGFRENADVDKSLYNGIVQWQIAPSTSFQLEARHIETERGDLTYRFDPEFFSEERNTEQRDILRLGARHQFTPSSVMIGSGFFQHSKESIDDPPGTRRFDSDTRDRLFELQNVFVGRQHRFLVGTGYFRGRQNQNFIGEDFSAIASSRNTYVYATLHNSKLTSGLEIGLSTEKLTSPDVGPSRKQTNPKFGVWWNVDSNTTLRAAFFRVLQRKGLGEQTIEPTQVAGFNQFYDDFQGTDSRRWGVGLDHKFRDQSIYSGIELSGRRLKIPLSFTNEIFDWAEKSHRAYLYWTPLKRLSLSAEWFAEKFIRPPDFPGVEVFTRVETDRVPLTARLFFSDRISGMTRLTLVRQVGDYFSRDGTPFSAAERFSLVDLGLEYRIPNRRGIFSLEVRNALDRRFRFQETNISSPVIPRSRAVLGRFSLSL